MWIRNNVRAKDGACYSVLDRRGQVRLVNDSEDIVGSLNCIRNKTGVLDYKDAVLTFGGGSDHRSI